ncbi:MAG TPA: hypothetical protein VFS40_07165 [Gemmatimonadales bacterium]|nr:hypothetical protein [Gemmatimonadales bacterium]
MLRFAPRLRASLAAPSALVALALLALAPAPARAQAPASLGFLGFSPGDSVATLGARVTELGGRPLRCNRSRTDPRVQECRATLVDPERGAPLELWASAIDGVAGVITLSGRLGGDQLDQWREALETSYGRAGARVQGPQWSMQWVRRGRMLRLTWRVEKGEKVASVSLVDGRTLDDWGRTRAGRASRGGG